jgi:hypothetical protein
MVSIELKKDVQPLEQLTLGDLFSRMKPSQLWSVLAALAALIAGAFALGAKFFHTS